MEEKRITNDKQYEIMKSQIEQFTAALKDTSTPENVHPKIVEAQRGAIRFKLQEMQKQVDEYNKLKTYGTQNPQKSSFKS